MGMFAILPRLDFCDYVMIHARHASNATCADILSTQNPHALLTDCLACRYCSNKQLWVVGLNQMAKSEDVVHRLFWLMFALWLVPYDPSKRRASRASSVARQRMHFPMPDWVTQRLAACPPNQVCSKRQSDGSYTVPALVTFKPGITGYLGNATNWCNEGRCL